MRHIKKVIVHCTDSDDSLDIGYKEIDEWHRQRGWLSASGISCGYHWIIRRDGKIEAGRPEIESGAHVKDHNSTSIGIVWVGRKKIGPKQLEVLMKKIRGIINRYRLTPLNVHGHSEFDPNKTCPNLDMDWFRAQMLFEQEEL